MAKIKSPLLMADGARVRTMEELREHFDIASVLTYYDNGKLQEWLENYYYDAEADEVGRLDPSSADIKEKLCDILGVCYAIEEAGNISMADISDKNRRLEKLKKFTSDDEFLKAVDYVAFTQEELQSILDAGAKKIYLCQEEDKFEIPDAEGVTYIGVNHPSIIVPEQFGEKGIVFQNVDIGIEGILISARKYSANQDYGEAVKLWSEAAVLGSAEAQCELGKCYHKGNGVTRNYAEACKWYRKAAEQGDVCAQYNLGDCYYGKGVMQDYGEAIKWYRKAAEQGYVEAQNRLGICYAKGKGVKQDYGEAVKWYKEAAERGNADAQFSLGRCYYLGNGVAQDHAEASKWYKKAAEQGNTNAKNMLDTYYAGKKDVAQDDGETCKQYRKAVEQGHKEAIQERPRRKGFEEYVENCKKFLGLIHRMPGSWNACNGELNSHKGRVQYAKFMNSVVEHFNPKSRFGHIINENIYNLRVFTQLMFSRHTELRITEIHMNGDPDYPLCKVNSDLSIVWDEESSTLKEDFEEYISLSSVEPDRFSVEWMESNCLADVYFAFQCFGVMRFRTDTHECLYKQFFDSLLKALAGNDEMLDEVLMLSKQYPIVYDKDMENAFIWKYADKAPCIEIRDGNQRYKYVTASVYLKAYETKTLLIHFCNMPLNNYTTRYNIVKNEYTEINFATFTSTTNSLAEVEWGNWVSKDVCELKITKNNDSTSGELIIEIMVDEVESAVAVIKNI